jgi:hypothetical protein
MGKEQGKTKNKWAYRKLPTYMTRSKIILKCQKQKFQTGILLEEPTL